jgi:ATP-dependent DNA ligase
MCRVRRHELEGVVAKRLDESYLPGERRWVKGQEPSLLAVGA